MAIHTYHDDAHPPPERRKTVLFCPECGHESPITGDWNTDVSGDERVLVCTACGSVVDRRSRRRTDVVEAT
ncbi:hypothetical protein [Natrinema salaciae]|uniref:DUF8106 domain-containing protein n=1 Tax=Natrinema salaciae TaxID=1186196 RepID=A0A1H9GF49_9EURY|nr:hypothetical protein [Natrinema salaciae]SEQ48689.1 hypothetical protein SAMN04489841_1864 [Natrinema salaciae]